MRTCPEGHATTATDYCETCGVPLPSADAPGHVIGSMTSDQVTVCPNCGIHASAEALFCEACGFDYTTGTLPRTPTAAEALLDIDAPVPEPAVTPAEPTAAPMPDEPVAAPTPEEPVAAPEPADPPADAASEETPAAPTPAEPVAEPAAGESPSPQPAAPAAARPLEWVAELWVDPAWYEGQDTPDEMPSPGLPEIVALRGRSLLVGRRSSGSVPDVDCHPDTGVSRRHARFSSDGRRWWVEDLDSSNGTYVAAASAPLPVDPIHGRRELDADDRIYLGGWTRMVIRRATTEEQTTDAEEASSWT